MSLKATVSAYNPQQNDASHIVTYSQSRTIQTRTSVAIVPQIVYSTGLFRNKGPIPPQANHATTYTVIWSTTNSSNDVQGAEVHANLPGYVQWLGVTSPSSESITWNKDTNEVIWHVGDIAAGTGYTKSARQAVFQVQLTPSINQIGSEADIVNNIILTGKDAFTGAQITKSASDLTTVLTTDPKYSATDQKVTQ